MFEDKVLKHKRAEGYYRRNAALGNVDGAWKNFVESNKVPDPRPMVQDPRNMYAQGQLVRNTVDGSRPGYNGNPGALKNFNKALDSFYNEFGKEVVDAASIQEYGVPFDEYRPANDPKGNKRKNFVKYFKQDMKDYGEYIGTKHPDKDRRTLKKGIRDIKKADIKLKMMDEIKNNEFFDPKKFAKDNNITIEQLKAEAKQLQRNIYKKRPLPKNSLTLPYIPNNIDVTDNILKVLTDKTGEFAKFNLVINESNKIGNVMFDAFGRVNLKGTNTPNPNYNLPKLDAINKNFKEYDILKTYLKDNFNIITELDHPLDKKTIQTIMNSSAADLTNINILEENLNTGFKKTLNNKYRQAVLDGNLDQKKAVKTIAKKFNLNIGSVPDNQFVKGQVGPFQTNLIDKGVGSFETLNIKDEMLKSLKNADKLNTEWGKYIRENPGVFKDAGIDLKTLQKPKNVENIATNIDAIIKELGGKNNVTKLLANGTANTEQKQALKEIMRMGSGLMRGAGQMLNPAEFFKLRNLIGPGAWAAMGAFEAGIIGYDTINNNTPLNEALSDNWVTGWAMPWTKKEAQIKNLGEENISSSPAMQKYMEQVKLMAEYERGEKVLTGLKTRYGDQEHAKVLYENQQAKLDKINNDWVNLQETAMVERDGEMVPVTGGEIEFQKAVSDMEGERQAGEYIQEDYRFGNQGIDKKGKVVDVNEYGYTDVGDETFFKKILPDSWVEQGTPIKKDPQIVRTSLPPQLSTSGYHKMPKYDVDLTKYKKQPGVAEATTTPLGEGELEGITQYGRDMGHLHPRFGEMSEEHIKYMQAAEKWRQLFKQSPTGLHGAKFAEGGIANTRIGFRTGSSIASILSKFFKPKPKKTITIKRGESGTIGASGNSKKDFLDRYYFPPKGGFTNQSADARYFSKLGGPKGKPKVLTAEITPQELKEGYRLRSLDSKDPEIGDIIIPKSAKDKVKTDYYNTIRARIEKILKNND